MKKKLILLIAVGVCFMASCTANEMKTSSRGVLPESAMSELKDLAAEKTVDPNEVYRIGLTGIAGTVQKDHFLVTGAIKGTAAEGRVKPGDRIVGMQHKGMGTNIRATVYKQMYRLGRDYDGWLVVDVERDSALSGKGNKLTYHLRIPPNPGVHQHFGPTGIYGKIYGDHIEVTKTAKGSPADGKLSAGDKIVGVDSKKVSGDDVYELFTKAIDKAETKQQKGVLKLKVKRNAGIETVKLQLKVLGGYSPTAPINCPKTDAIIARTADKLKDSGKGKLNIGFLGLLATGDQKYIDDVGRALRGSGFANPKVRLNPSAGYVSWNWAYQTIALCEYYLLTKDEYVLPAIKAHAVAIAQGQDAAGLWNHRMADPKANFGKLHGRLYGYGAINQTSVALFTAMILAEKCGVEDPELRAAVDKTHKFYSNFIGKGALPYGNHAPFEHLLNNNGTSGSLAVAMSIIGNREGAKFFSMLSAAGYDELLTGHSGPYFNILWSGLGANVAGPEVSAAFSKKTRWLTTMNRTYDDRFLYMVPMGGVFSYSGLSSEGLNLLNLCLPRRALYITGKDADQSIWLKGTAARKAVNAGVIDDSKQTAKSLLKLLGSPLPRVRFEAAELLAVKDVDVTKQVMQMLTKGTQHQKIGACHAIRRLKVTSATDELMMIVRDEKANLWLRELAAQTMAELGNAQKYGQEMLEMIVKDKPYDLYGDFDRTLGQSLAKIFRPKPDADPDPYAHGVDKDVLYKAAGKLLDHKHHWARQSGMLLIQKIPLEDFHLLADKIVYVIKDTDRTYTAYHADGQREYGLNILNNLNIKEVIDLSHSTLKEKVGRAGAKSRGRLRVMKKFRGEAKYAIPQIKAAFGGRAKDIIKTIESTPPRKMISFEEAKRAGKQKK